jgi:hypothetical protein
MRMVHTGLSPKTLNSMRGSLSISPSLLAAHLPQYSKGVLGSGKSHAAVALSSAPHSSVAADGLPSVSVSVNTPSPKAAAAAAAAEGAGLKPLVLHSRSSAASSAAAHSSSGAGSGVLPHSPKAVAKTPHKTAAAAAAGTKKRITFDVPEDAEEEEREVAEEAAAAHDSTKLAGNAAASGPQLLTPTNTLAEGLPDAPEHAAADVLAAAAGKLAEGTKGKATDAKAAAAAAAAAKSGGHDADQQQQQFDQDEAVAWATVVEKGGVREGEAAAVAAGAQEGASPFHAHQADDYSPFQVNESSC